MDIMRELFGNSNTWMRRMFVRDRIAAQRAAKVAACGPMPISAPEGQSLEDGHWTCSPVLKRWIWMRNPPNAGGGGGGGGGGD